MTTKIVSINGKNLTKSIGQLADIDTPPNILTNNIKIVKYTMQQISSSHSLLIQAFENNKSIVITYDYQWAEQKGSKQRDALRKKIAAFKKKRSLFTTLSEILRAKNYFIVRQKNSSFMEEEIEAVDNQLIVEYNVSLQASVISKTTPEISSAKKHLESVEDQKGGADDIIWLRKKSISFKNGKKITLLRPESTDETEYLSPSGTHGFIDLYIPIPEKPDVYSVISARKYGDSFLPAFNQTEFTCKFSPRKIGNLIQRIIKSVQMIFSTQKGIYFLVDQNNYMSHRYHKEIPLPQLTERQLAITMDFIKDMFISAKEGKMIFQAHHE
ncbi:hypothetical protein ACTFIW_000808 [Dictyostelium discoideum]